MSVACVRGEEGGFFPVVEKGKGGEGGDAPAVRRPMMRVPAMLVCTMGMVSPSSLSKAE